MALLVNELATNAVKHGALSNDSGRVDVRWTQDEGDAEDRKFRLSWRESGGTGMVVAPDRTSFGTLLMERSVRNNLGGTIERHWEPRSEEHTSELQSLMRISYAVFCLKKKNRTTAARTLPQHHQINRHPK